MTKNNAQHIVEIVGHPAGEPPHRLQFLGLNQLLFQLPVLFLGLLAFGNVAADTKDQLLSGPVGSADADFDRKGCPVFATKPGLKGHAGRRQVRHILPNLLVGKKLVKITDGKTADLIE
ncbi:MAG: hypothetical protein ACD_75C00840G0003 [uncultured bacterium]|nr:MAG: hypothetical protein ACD_75C00840G0003 [uncultured bacterium]